MAGADCFNFDGVLVLCRQLWAAADDLDSIMKQRDEDANIALAEWEGPHARTFKTGLEVDETDERSLVRLFRTAAGDWAHAWVDAMNDENRDRHNKATDQADSAWEWVPGVSDAPVTELTSITTVPSGPEFNPTGSFYTNTAS